MQPCLVESKEKTIQQKNSIQAPQHFQKKERMTLVSSHLTLSMRALLRATTLKVSLLAQHAMPDSIELLGAECLKLVAEFDRALEHRGVADDIRHEAVYAQCALIDETVTCHLSENTKLKWFDSPLHFALFQYRDAGERIVESLKARMSETPPDLDMLECYSIILNLGFKGRYMNINDKERIALITALNKQIDTLRSTQNHPLILDPSGRRRFECFYQVSPWVLAGLTIVATLLLYLLMGATLDHLLTHWLEQK